MRARNIVLFAFALILVLVCSQLFAATFIVTKTNDTNDGACGADCSLREAILAANATTAADTIILPAGSYNLTIAGNDDASAVGDLDTAPVGGNLTIQGDGAGTTVITSTISDRILDVQNIATTVTVNKVHFRNGNISGNSGGNIVVRAPSNGSLVLNDCELENGQASAGGAIQVSNGSLTANRCLFHGNTALAGGAVGLNIGRTATFTNCTFTGNSASNQGGAIANTGVVNLTNVTISNNSTGGNGGGIRTETGAVTNARNSIIADNSAFISSPDCDAINSLGFNLIGNTSGSVISGNITGMILDVDPRLAPLAQNGGPTATQVPGADSPAIGNGDANNCPADDQRGMPRPQGGGCDIGAVERACLAWNIQQPATVTQAEIVMDPADPSIIYAGLKDSTLRVLKSTDFGIVWQQVNNGLPSSFVIGLAIDPRSSQVLYAALGDNNGVFKSTNGGASWSPSNTGFNGFASGIAIDPRNPSVLYLAANGVENSLIRSTDSGGSWSVANTGLPPGADVREVAVNPLNSHVYAASSTGIFLSTDNGATWTAKNAGLTDLNMFTVAVDPGNGSHLLSGGALQASVSFDGGETWTAIPEFANAGNFAFDPSNPELVYASSIFPNRIFKSSNGGTTWKPFSSGLPLSPISGLAVSSVAGIPFAFSQFNGIVGLTQPATFCDDFDDGDVSDWTQKGTFDATSGALEGIFAKKGAAFAPSPVCANCSLDASFTMTAGQPRASVFGWFVDNKTRVELRAMEDKDIWMLVQKVAGTKIVKAKFNKPINLNTLYNVTLSFDGSAFHVFLDGTDFFTVPTTVPPPAGSVGVQIKATHGVPASVVFDDVVVF